jgi:2-amino-4-hydroxy-6-hydroxymethyldihydropteridine diphosphokinase
VRWGPRIIDIDLLCCGEYVFQQPGLQVPHPLLHLRAFVMVPLLELEPDLVLPGIGPLRPCLDKLKDQPVEILQ